MLKQITAHDVIADVLAELRNLVPLAYAQARRPEMNDDPAAKIAKIVMKLGNVWLDHGAQLRKIDVPQEEPPMLRPDSTLVFKPAPAVPAGAIVLTDSESGIAHILFERQHQVLVNCYDDAHDDAHVDGELAQAARYYAAWACGEPWAQKWPFAGQPPHHALLDENFPSMLKRLRVAGAFCAAEIDRLKRLEKRQAAACPQTGDAPADPPPIEPMPVVVPTLLHEPKRCEAMMEGVQCQKDAGHEGGHAAHISIAGSDPFDDDIPF